MSKYVKIEKYVDGEHVIGYVEPMNLDNISVVIEDEFLLDGEVGDELRIKIVELTDEEFANMENQIDQ